MWTSDGTVAGTSMVVDLNQGAHGVNVAKRTFVYGNKIFFPGDDGTTGFGGHPMESADRSEGH